MSITRYPNPLINPYFEKFTKWRSTEIHVAPEPSWELCGDRSYPTLYMKNQRVNGKWQYAATSLDPVPTYAHPVDLVQERVAMTVEAFPLPFHVDYWLPEYESMGRSNGTCWVMTGESERGELGDYVHEPTSSHICLSGKRIPLMPAMTRYLVAHEYGHAVEDFLAFVHGMSDGEFKKLYMALRGVDYEEKGYNARQWHQSFGEIFANDFRILVCKVEGEFWPHPVPHPEKVPAIIEFWQEQVFRAHIGASAYVVAAPVEEAKPEIEGAPV